MGISILILVVALAIAVGALELATVRIEDRTRRLKS